VGAHILILSVLLASSVDWPWWGGQTNAEWTQVISFRSFSMWRQRVFFELTQWNFFLPEEKKLKKLVCLRGKFSKPRGGWPNLTRATKMTWPGSKILTPTYNYFKPIEVFNLDRYYIRPLFHNNYTHCPSKQTSLLERAVDEKKTSLVWKWAPFLHPKRLHVLWGFVFQNGCNIREHSKPLGQNLRRNPCTWG